MPPRNRKKAAGCGEGRDGKRRGGEWKRRDCIGYVVVYTRSVIDWAQIGETNDQAQIYESL